MTLPQPKPKKADNKQTTCCTLQIPLRFKRQTQVGNLSFRSPSPSPQLPMQRASEQPRVQAAMVGWGCGDGIVSRPSQDGVAKRCDTILAASHPRLARARTTLLDHGFDIHRYQTTEV